jgi:hypothetical protein
MSHFFIKPNWLSVVVVDEVYVLQQSHSHLPFPRLLGTFLDFWTSEQNLFNRVNTQIMIGEF